jgi:hypothetical protein
MKFSQGLSDVLAIVGMSDGTDEELESSQPAVWSAAEDGRTAEVMEILTLDSLSYTDLANKNLFHVAAESPGSGKSLKALSSFQTESHLTAKDSFGKTPLHYAAKTMRLDQIRPSLLTRENMELKDKDGVSVLSAALSKQSIKDLGHVLPPKTMAAFLNHRFAPVGDAAGVRIMDLLDKETLEGCKPFAAKELQPDLDARVAKPAGVEIS